MATIDNEVGEKRSGTEQYDDFIRELMKLPDFHRLPLPDSVRERFNIPLDMSHKSIQEATRATYDNSHSYINKTIEIITTPADVVFPAIPEKHFLLEGLEEETITVKDQTSPEMLLEHPLKTLSPKESTD
jgi:hypothetical protein